MQRLKYLSYIASTYLYLLGAARRRLPMLWLAVLGASFLDVIGVGLIVPFVAVATKPDSFSEAAWARPLTQFMQGWSHEGIVLLLGFVFLAVFLVKSVVSMKLNLSITAFAYRQDTLLRVRLLESYMYAPYEYHLANDRARILNSLVQNVNKYSSSLLSLLKLLSEFVMVVLIFALILFSSPVVFLVLIFSFACMAFIYFVLIPGQTNKWGNLSVSSSRDMLKSIQESIEGLKEIRTLGVEDSFVSRLKNAGDISEKSSLKLVFFSILPRYFLESGLVMVVVGLIVAISFSGRNFLDMIPMVALLGLASLRLLPSLTVVLSSVSVIRHSFPAVKQIRDDLENTSALPCVTHTSSVKAMNHFDSLSLKDVFFCYEGAERMIVSGLSLDIKSQQSIGIIGGSGAGKTTLVDLILGLLTPKEGGVILNGKPLAEDLSAWWSMVAYIPQSPFLSDDSIRRNVALGIDDESIDNDKVNYAISMSQLGSFIEHLPLGKDTIIGDRGIRLSGGQRQRIAIARAMYFDRQVLIFDEATSALDSETEKEIVSSISALHGTKTTIIIAHRMSTLKDCDRIIEIKNGVISAEYGSIDEVS